MQIPKDKTQRVVMLFDRLKDLTISRGLYELLGGWLISRDSGEEKEKQLSALFDERFCYTVHPSRKAYDSFRAFVRKHGLNIKTSAGVIPLRRRMRFQLAAAAVLMAALSGSVYLFTERAAIRPEPDRVGVMVTISTPAANPHTTTNDTDTAYQVASGDDIHTLPDQSWVRLGEGGTISYAENFGGNRRVELRGKAHFNVAKARTEGDHFTIHTDHFDIRVLGTDFDVHSPAGESHSTIDLYHGSVEVTAGGRTVMMKPTDHLHFDHATKAITLATISYTRLRYDGMPGLEFEDTPLTDVLATVEREFGVRFTIDGRIPPVQRTVRGDFTHMRSLDELMRVLQTLSGRFTYEITQDEIRIKIETI